MAGTSDRAVAPSLDAGDLNPRPKDPHDRSVSCSCQPASNPSNLGVPPVPLDRSGEASNVGRPASTLLSQLYTHRGIVGVQSPSGAREGDPMFGRGHPTSTAYAMSLVAGGPLLVGIPEPGEFTSGHATGAISTPLGQLDQHVPTLATAGPATRHLPAGSDLGRPPGSPGRREWTR